MKFDEAIRSVINRYAQFTGRASRSEYWYWVLFLVLASAAIGIAGSVVSAVGYLSWLFNLATIVPSIAVAVRRLHDVGKSGWWLLASLVPVLGGLYLIYLAIQPSDGPNAYGVAPDGAVAASA